MNDFLKGDHAVSCILMLKPDGDLPITYTCYSAYY